MGFFDFLRKKQAEAVKFSELSDWLNKQVQDKNLSQKIAAAKQDINLLLESCRKKLDALESAKLVNENIPVKEKHIMEGHRKTYIQRLRKFLDEIHVPDDFAQVGHYNARFSESLNRLSEETIKNYAVLTQFFEQEASQAAKSLKEIESALSKLQSDIDKEGVELIKEAKIRLKQYQDDLDKKERLGRELTGHRSELDMLTKKKERIESNLSHLKSGPEYAQFSEFIEEKKKSEERIHSLEKDLTITFSEISRPLKKHAHNNVHEKLVERYLADASGALEEDASLAIHDIVKKMILEAEDLGLKDKQLERAHEIVSKLSRDFLHETRLELSRLKILNKELASKINKSVVALTISENESWLKSLENKIREWEELARKTQKDLEEINTDYLKQKAKEKAREVKKDIIIEE